MASIFLWILSPLKKTSKLDPSDKTFWIPTKTTGADHVTAYRQEPIMIIMAGNYETLARIANRELDPYQTASSL